MAKGKQQNNNTPHPLAHQLNNLLNLAGSVRANVLDNMGTANNSPLLHRILQSGYAGDNGMGSDRDALNQAIMYARQGYTLAGPSANQQEEMGLQGNTNATGPLGRNTASRNMVKQLVSDRVKAGYSQQEARQLVSDELRRENQQLRDRNLAANPAGSLTPEEQQYAQARKQAQQQGATLTASGQPSVGDGTFDPTTGTNTQGFDPVGLAQAVYQQKYLNRGMNDINQYQQSAQLMGGIVPEQLKPLYDLMVQQRAQEMQDNLGLMNSQMQSQPLVQTLKDAATDYRTAQRSGSSGNALDQALGVSGGGSGTGGQGGVSGVSNGALNGLDLSRQIMNGLNYGQYMGNSFNKFETPVISNNQLTYLRDFLPRSKKGAQMVGPIAQYLGAQSYPQMGYSSGY